MPVDYSGSLFGAAYVLLFCGGGLCDSVSVCKGTYNSIHAHSSIIVLKKQSRFSRLLCRTADQQYWRSHFPPTVLLLVRVHVIDSVDTRYIYASLDIYGEECVQPRQQRSWWLIADLRDCCTERIILDILRRAGLRLRAALIEGHFVGNFHIFHYIFFAQFCFLLFFPIFCSIY